VLISRTIARKRIAAGERPSFKAAWLPVAADVLIIALVLAALWQPALTFVYVMQLPFLMAVIYAPLQIVIIVSTIWAVRSRWEDKG